MPNEASRVALVGSHREPLPESVHIGPTDPNERVEVTIRLRRREAAPPLQRLDEPATEPRHLTHSQYAALHSADPQDLARIQRFASEQHLEIIETDAVRRTIRLGGTAAAMSQAFGVQFESYQHPRGNYRGRTGSILLPPDLVPIVDPTKGGGVFGLDNRPQAHPHFRYPQDQPGIQPRSANNTFSPLELARLYNFPVGDGNGQAIAIIELGGGFRDDDLNTYFQNIGSPRPKVTAVSVDGGTNQPSGPNGDDGEVMLDIEVAGAIANGANILVYFAPNTDAGFLDAITTAIHDQNNNPSVISISWGSAEVDWTSQALLGFDDAFKSAAALGITVCCASGDNGSADGVSPPQAKAANVDFPASSPNVLACGGTRLTAAGSKITQEVVWENSSGGGISDTFDLPSYQQSAHVPVSANGDGRIGRGVPDVAGDADPNTGYKVRVDGTDMVIGGTSAVAPLWAGLIGVMNQLLGQRIGFLNSVLYTKLTSSCNDITAGSNGAYQAGPGWDACTGLGSPDGARLLKGLSGKS